MKTISGVKLVRGVDGSVSMDATRQARRAHMLLGLTASMFALKTESEAVSLAYATHEAGVTGADVYADVTDATLRARLVADEAAFDKDVLEHLANGAQWDDSIASAVAQVFVKYPDLNQISTSVVIDFAMANLRDAGLITPVNSTAVKGFMAEYIQENSSKDASDETLFGSQKGRNGGMWCWKKDAEGKNVPRVTA